MGGLEMSAAGAGESGLHTVDIEHVDGAFRSVQRLTSAGVADMPALVDRYFGWLQEFFFGVVRVLGRSRDERVVMRVLGVPAIRLRQLSRTPQRVVYAVEGGVLAKPGGEFVFASGPDDDAVAVLRGFRPRLPPWLYERTHGPVHASVMRKFCRSLGVGS